MRRPTQPIRKLPLIRTLAEGGTRLQRHGPDAWRTISQIVDTARASLDVAAWDFYAGGAGQEASVVRNRAALDALALRPRVLQDVRDRSVATELLGLQLALPVMLAPIGALEAAHPDAAVGVARGAELAGTAAFISINSSPALRQVRSAAPSAAIVLQIYPFTDPEISAHALTLAHETDCAAICITVDSSVYGRRERDLRRGYDGRAHAKPNYEGREWTDEARAAASWTDAARIRDSTALPVIVKGILTAEDAQEALRYGADCVYVSNHGGRQLDSAQGSVEVLPEILRAVDGRVPVLVDGSFSSGSDVVKAIALGASAVLVGRLAAWALAAGGAAGIARAMEILKAETETTLGQLGGRRLRELTPEHVVRSQMSLATPWSNEVVSNTDASTDQLRT